MRRVACFAASSAIDAREVPEADLDGLVEVVASWLRTKGCPALPTDRMTFTMNSRKVAEVTRTDWSAAAGRVCEITLDEPTDAGRFYTRICLGARERRLHVFVELRAGAAEDQIAPVSVDVRSPQVVKDIFACRKWTVGATPIVLSPVKWSGRDSAGRFIAVLWHRERNLPIVAVSQHHGDALTPSFVNDLSRDLCGLALVVSLDDGASWGISLQIGREWSCHSGAVRIYWPMRGVRKASDHPFWTRERLLADAPSASSAAARIRSQIRRRLLSLSTFALDDPPELTRLKEEAAKEVFEKLRREAEQRGDQAGLAEHYFSESARLEGIVTQRDAEIERLTAQVESLSQVWRYRADASSDEIPPEPLAAVTTVEEAVNLARLRLSGDLVFGADVAANIRGLSSDAGPPEKIYEYLEILAEMTQARRAGGLGKDLLLWLKDQGLKASGESETVLNSPSEMRRRTWDDGIGSRVFEKHLKPSDGTSPDRCARIYFDYDDSRKKTVVGYVGRHL